MVQKGKDTHIVFILIFVLAFQFVALVSLGFAKKGFHIDETYTYILSNSYDASRISHDTNAMTQWNEGEYFNKFITVEEGEGFSYNKVKYNNALDAHPPLYYYFIHTISSFFPGNFSKWFGLGLNYILFLGIQIILYLLICKTTKNKWLGIAAISLNGGLAAILDMLLFIRMYTLLTLFSVLFVYIHYSMCLAPGKKRLYAFSAITAFLGIYTQYYFAFLALFVSAIYCLWLLKNRRYKLLTLYVSLMLLAVAMVFVLYPAGISQITGSETNNIGKEVSANIFNFKALPRAFFRMVVQIISKMFSTFFHLKILSVACILITVIIAFLLRNKKVQNEGENEIGKILLILGAILILTITIITHVSGKFTYVRYVYFLYPLFVAFAVFFISFLSSKIRLHLKTLCIGVICFGLIGTISYSSNGLCSYAFNEKHKNETEIIELCKDKPLILISNGTTYHPTGNLEIIRKAPEVYICKYEDNVDFNEVLVDKTVENGVVFMVLTDKEWSEGFDGEKVMESITEKTTVLSNFYCYGKSDFSTLYICK